MSSSFTGVFAGSRAYIVSSGWMVCVAGTQLIRHVSKDGSCGEGVGSPARGKEKQHDEVGDQSHGDRPGKHAAVVEGIAGAATALHKEGGVVVVDVEEAPT